MIRKLQLKFIVIIMTIVSVMLYVICGMVYSSLKQELEQHTIGMLRGMVNQPFLRANPGNADGDYMVPHFLLEVSPEGALTVTSNGYFDVPDDEQLSQMVQAVRADGKDVGILKDYGLRFASHETRWGSLTVAFCDMRNERTIENSLLRLLLLTGGFSFLIFLAISVFFSQWAVKPVEQAWKEQKQFFADASHELKTPLTVIMTNAELLQSPDFDADSRCQFSESILIMSKQMRGLVEKMLELARADNGTKQLVFSDVDLSNLSEDCELTFEGLFFERGLTLTTDITPNIHIRGSAEGMRQVIDILLDNAQKYSANGGETKISLTANHGRCRLSVANPGEEISHADLKNIFRRFYRADAARSRDGSFGLGLPIAQQLVTQQNGKIWAESGNGINTFVVELPIIRGKE